MNLVIKACRWFDGFAMKMGEWALVVLPALVLILGFFVAAFHCAIYIIGKVL